MLADLWQTLASAKTHDDAAATDGAALLTDLSVLTFTGPDVLGFLQGYLTCDLDALEDGSFHPTALTNIKGRVVANGWVAQRSDQTIDWIIHVSLADRVAGFMKPYLAFSRTTLTTRDDDHIVVGLAGDQQPIPLVIDDEDTLQGISTTHRIIDENAFRLACIDAGIVLISQATSEQFLPQMLGLVEAGAVDFEKGCYLGQEVVARAQHRGEVKRKLHRFRGSVPMPEPGARLTDDSGRESGTLLLVADCTDATETDSGDCYRCLAVVREPVDPIQTSADSVLTLES